MKKLLFFIFLLNFVQSIEAQDFTLKAQLNPPTIGLEVPNFSIQTYTNQGTKTQKFADLKGKIIILEFWATTCKPCIPAMDHLEILEAQFSDKMKVFAVTDEDHGKIEHFLEKHPTGVSIVLDQDRNLNDNFFHNFIPHTVIIDQQGIVRAFTTPDQMNEDVILQLLNNQEITVRPSLDYRNEPTYSPEAQQAVVATRKSQNETYKVIITSYQDGKQSEINRESEREMKFVNCSLPLIYQTLYGISATKTILEVADESKYTFEKPNMYCFELLIPSHVNKSLLEVGTKQLETFFELKSKQEVRNRNVFALQLLENFQAPKDSSNLKNNGLTIKDLMTHLEQIPSLNGVAVINETGLPDTALIDLIKFQSNEKPILQRLASIGLVAEEKMKDVECLILYEEAVLTKAH